MCGMLLHTIPHLCLFALRLHVFYQFYQKPHKKHELGFAQFPENSDLVWTKCTIITYLIILLSSRGLGLKMPQDFHSSLLPGPAFHSVLHWWAHKGRNSTVCRLSTAQSINVHVVKDLCHYLLTMRVSMLWYVCMSGVSVSPFCGSLLQYCSAIAHFHHAAARLCRPSTWHEDEQEALVPRVGFRVRHWARMMPTCWMI